MQQSAAGCATATRDCTTQQRDVWWGCLWLCSESSLATSSSSMMGLKHGACVHHVRSWRVAVEQERDCAAAERDRERVQQGVVRRRRGGAAGRLHWLRLAAGLAPRRCGPLVLALCHLRRVLCYKTGAARDISAAYYKASVVLSLSLSHRPGRHVMQQMCMETGRLLLEHLVSSHSRTGLSRFTKRLCARPSVLTCTLVHRAP